MTDFEEGVFYAASLLVDYLDQPTLAADVLEQAGLCEADLSLLDDSDKESMKRLQEEDSRCNFTGI